MLQCVNKVNGYFTQEDESLIKIISEFCNVLLNNAINLNEQVVQYNKLRHILKVSIPDDEARRR